MGQIGIKIEIRGHGRATSCWVRRHQKEWPRPQTGPFPENQISQSAGLSLHRRDDEAGAFIAARPAGGDGLDLGMVGINVPIPVPLAYHTFGGWKRSAFGDTKAR